MDHALRAIAQLLRAEISEIVAMNARDVEAAKAAVYVKGGDYNSESLNAEERAVLEKIGAKIDIVPFVKGYSTSRLLEKLHEFAK